MHNFALRVIAEIDKRNGNVLAVYFQIRTGKTAETREVADGCAFANYNHKGKLLGIEILAPCKIKVLDQIARDEPASVRTFLKGSIPRKMVLA